jgi:hypothetical protein
MSRGGARPEDILLMSMDASPESRQFYCAAAPEQIDGQTRSIGVIDGEQRGTTR